MRKMVSKWGVACLLVILVVVFMCGCQKEEKKKEVTINVETASMDSLVQYMKNKGYISKEVKPVDINITAGYVKDNTGGSMPVAVVADQAFDYDGIWLLWWDKKNQTDNYEGFEAIKMNENNVVIQGGAAIFEVKAVNGSFAIAFSKDYSKAEEVLKDFEGLKSE